MLLSGLVSVQFGFEFHGLFGLGLKVYYRLKNAPKLYLSVRFTVYRSRFMWFGLKGLLMVKKYS